MHRGPDAGGQVGDIPGGAHGPVGRLRPELRFASRERREVRALQPARRGPQDRRLPSAALLGGMGRALHVRPDARSSGIRSQARERPRRARRASRRVQCDSRTGFHGIRGNPDVVTSARRVLGCMRSGTLRVHDDLRDHSYGLQQVRPRIPSMHAALFWRGRPTTNPHQGGGARIGPINLPNRQPRH